MGLCIAGSKLDLIMYALDGDHMTCNGSDELNPREKRVIMGNVTVIKGPDEESKVTVYV